MSEYWKEQYVVERKGSDCTYIIHFNMFVEIEEKFNNVENNKAKHRRKKHVGLKQWTEQKTWNITSKTVNETKNMGHNK